MPFKITAETDPKHEDVRDYDPDPADSTIGIDDSQISSIGMALSCKAGGSSCPGMISACSTTGIIRLP